MKAYLKILLILSICSNIVANPDAAIAQIKAQIVLLEALQKKIQELNYSDPSFKSEFITFGQDVKKNYDQTLAELQNKLKNAKDSFADANKQLVKLTKPVLNFGDRKTEYNNKKEALKAQQLKAKTDEGIASSQITALKNSLIMPLVTNLSKFQNLFDLLHTRESIIERLASTDLTKADKIKLEKEKNNIEYNLASKKLIL
jgi:uncharacterized protein (DUF3084 family)